jgi:hypothetical protein
MKLAGSSVWKRGAHDTVRENSPSHTRAAHEKNQKTQKLNKNMKTETELF